MISGTVPVISDSYFTFFIAAYFKTVYTNSPTTIIGSEAMIVY